MSKKALTSFSVRMDHFLQNPHVGKIMFCKRFKVRVLWEISPGAVLDLGMAWPGMVQLCRKLYLEDDGWFVGDVEKLT